MHRNVNLKCSEIGLRENVTVPNMLFNNSDDQATTAKGRTRRKVWFCRYKSALCLYKRQVDEIWHGSCFIGSEESFSLRKKEDQRGDSILIMMVTAIMIGREEEEKIRKRRLEREMEIRYCRWTWKITIIHCFSRWICYRRNHSPSETRTIVNTVISLPRNTKDVAIRRGPRRERSPCCHTEAVC